MATDTATGKGGNHASCNGLLRVGAHPERRLRAAALARRRRRNAARHRNGVRSVHERPVRHRPGEHAERRHAAARAGEGPGLASKASRSDERASSGKASASTTSVSREDRTDLRALDGHDKLSRHSPASPASESLIRSRLTLLPAPSAARPVAAAGGPKRGRPGHAAQGRRRCAGKARPNPRGSPRARRGPRGRAGCAPGRRRYG